MTDAAINGCAAFNRSFMVCCKFWLHIFQNDNVTCTFRILPDEKI